MAMYLIIQILLYTQHMAFEDWIWLTLSIKATFAPFVDSAAAAAAPLILPLTTATSNSSFLS